MSRSATALVLTFCGLALMILCSVSRKSRLSAGSFVFLLIILFGSSLFILSEIAEWVLGFLGRDITFTNRTRLWDLASHIIGQRPLTGLGYAAVWGEGGASVVAPKLGVKYIGGVSGGAHNGFLQTATEIGIPAVVLTFGFAGMSFYRSVRYYLQSPSPFLLFAVTFNFVFILRNTMENNILKHQHLSWILFVAVAVAVIRIGEIRRLDDPGRHRPFKGWQPRSLAGVAAAATPTPAEASVSRQSTGVP